ncbi:MAG: glycosyltransferase family 1 protein, partial [Mesorhizobium sp.]
MKIVQVQTQAEAAGAQRISDMVGEGLRARGHEVRTVFMYRKTEAYDRDPNVDFVLTDRPRGLPGQIRATVGLARYLRAAGPDAVITYQHYGNIFGTIGARLAGVRHIVANQSGAPQ